jgi:hypothetical protein
MSSLLTEKGIYPESGSRRRVLRKLSKGVIALVGPYALSKIIPLASAQTTTAITEIDVGFLKVPVTLDGHVEKEEWYSDSIDYQSTAYSDYFSSTDLPHFHLRAKFDEAYAYFAVDIPTSTLSTDNSLWLYFDTTGTGNNSAGAKGVYNLLLEPTGDNFYESPNPIANIPGSQAFPFPGTAFFKLFTRGQDYDWQRYWGSSPLSSDSHLQFELKVRNSILTKYANRIDFSIALLFTPKPLCAPNCGTLVGGTGVLSENGYLPMVFEQQALAEFGSEYIALLTCLAGAVAAIESSKYRYSRRDVLGISAFKGLSTKPTPKDSNMF